MIEEQPNCKKEYEEFPCLKEYATRGCLTPLADVYSFGLVALELFSGKPVRQSFGDDPNISVFVKALVLKDSKGDLLALVDPDLGNEYSSEEALRIINVAILCIDDRPMRPPPPLQTNHASNHRIARASSQHCRISG
ncbi:putative non-specific serine/threonine protein kinase [Helianthus anomalus]